MVGMKEKGNNKVEPHTICGIPERNGMPFYGLNHPTSATGKKP